MGEPILRVVTETDESVDDPSEDLLFLLLEGIERGEGSWLIVERLADSSGQTYAQTLRQDDGSYVVEYRAGSPEEHYGTVVGDLRTAHALVTGWAFALPEWQSTVTWERVTF